MAGDLHCEGFDQFIRAVTHKLASRDTQSRVINRSDDIVLQIFKFRI